MQTFAALVALSLNAILIENFIFSKFLGICPFLGVSKKTNTAVGMGFAVIFTMTLASALTYVVYRFILVPAELEYLKTIAFIIVIAALVQFIEMFLQKSLPSLYSALGIYLPLITTNCAVLGVALLNITNDPSLRSKIRGRCIAIRSHQRPDVRAWRDELNETYELKEIVAIAVLGIMYKKYLNKIKE